MHFRLSLLPALLLLTVPLGAFGQAKSAMTIDDVMKIRNVVDLSLSPDGETIAYVVSEADAKEARYRTNLWLVATRGGPPLQLTRGSKRNDKPAFAPDAKTIAFVSDRGGKPQVWLIPLDGGEARKLTDLPGNVVDLSWSADGKQVAVIASQAESDAEKQRKDNKTDVLVVEKEDRPDQLHIVDLATGKSRLLPTGSEHVLSASWSPDSMTLAVSVRRTSRLEHIFDVDLVAVTVKDGKVRPLVRRPGLDTTARYSPDGKQIAFISHNGKYDWIGNNYLCVMPARGGEPRAISLKHDEMLPWFDSQSYHWAGDGKTIYFTAARKLENHIYQVDIATGTVTTVTRERGIYDRLRMSADGKKAACLSETPSRPAEVSTCSLELGLAKVHTETNSFLDKLNLAEVKAVSWKAKDGLDIEGVLLLPRNAKGKLPLLAYIHGGPQGRFTLSFSPQRWGTVQAEPYPLHVLAGKGYAILCPNPRGSGGYGLAFRAANVKDWGQGDLEDIMAGVDHLIAEGIADPDRLGVMGWSYGGYMTGQVITKTTRFKAASAGAGVFNLTSMYGTTDIQPFMERYFGGPPWVAKAEHERASAIHRMDKVKTPTLIQHGDKDLRVPLSQSQELFRALKRQGVPTEFAVYPRQPHIIGEPNLQTDAMKRNVAWFDKWLAEKKSAALQAGFAESDITPKVGAKEKPVYMAGFGTGRKATAVNDPLMARAVVLGHGKTKMAFVSVDLVGMFRSSVERIRKQAGDFAYIVVSSTHNHEGPDTLGLWGPTQLQSGIDPDYLAFVEKQVVLAIQKADASRREVRASIGSVKVPELLRDSREPKVLHDDLVVLSFKDAKSGKNAGLVVQWNCHPETLDSRNTKISADYVGYTVKHLQDKHQCPTVYLTGTVGGLMTSLGVPIQDARGVALKDGTFEKTQRFGELLGEAADKAIASARPLTLTPMEVRTRTVALPMVNKGYILLKQLGVLERDSYVWEGPGTKLGAVAKDLDPKKKYAILSEIGHVRLGQLEVACIPGEIYPELVLDQVTDPAENGADFPDAPVEPAIYKQLKAPHRMLIGLANDEIGYIIPKRQWDEKAPFCYGRKRAPYGEINSLGPDTAMILCEAFRELVQGK